MSQNRGVQMSESKCPRGKCNTTLHSNISGRAWSEVREVELLQQQQLPVNEDSSSSNEKSSQESHLLPPSPSSMPSSLLGRTF